MTRPEIGETVVRGYAHGIITEIHPDGETFAFRELAVKAVADPRYGEMWRNDHTTDDYAASGAEEFFVLDGAEVDEVVCHDPVNIRVGRIITLFDVVEGISVPDIDDPEFTTNATQYSREIWLGKQAVEPQGIADYLDAQALKVIKNPRLYEPNSSRSTV